MGVTFAVEERWPSSPFPFTVRIGDAYLYSPGGKKRRFRTKAAAERVGRQYVNRLKRLVHG